jgi:hypothetical protein
VSEANYFAALLHAEDMAALRLIDPERDLSPAWRGVYQWVVNFARDRSALPKPLTVAGVFNVPLDRPPESASYYAEVISKNAKRAKLEEGLSQSVVPHLEGHDPDAAMAATADVIGKVRAEFPQPHDSRSFLPNMGANVVERWRDYEFRSQFTHALGLPFFLQTVTKMTLGMQAGEAWALISRPNMGKTFAAIAQGVYLWQMGYRVLFASMETPPRDAIPKSPRVRARLGAYADVARQRLTLRFDAIAARVSAWRLLNGKLNPQELHQYQQYLSLCEREGNNGWGSLRIVSTPRIRTIGQLEQEALEFQPDIIIWDSAYLAIDRGGKSSKRTDQAGYFLEECKEMFGRVGVPGLITWHFNREVAEDDTEASLNDIALTDDMPRLFDVIMFLFRTPDMVNAGEAIWRTGKVRDGVNVPELRSRFEVKRCIAFDEIGLGQPGQQAAAPAQPQQPPPAANVIGGPR